MKDYQCQFIGGCILATSTETHWLGLFVMIMAAVTAIVWTKSELEIAELINASQRREGDK